MTSNSTPSGSPGKLFLVALVLLGLAAMAFPGLLGAIRGFAPDELAAAPADLDQRSEDTPLRVTGLRYAVTPKGYVVYQGKNISENPIQPKIEVARVFEYETSMVAVGARAKEELRAIPALLQELSAMARKCVEGGQLDDALLSALDPQLSTIWSALTDDSGLVVPVARLTDSRDRGESDPKIFTGASLMDDLQVLSQTAQSFDMNQFMSGRRNCSGQARHAQHAPKALAEIKKIYAGQEPDTAIVLSNWPKAGGIECALQDPDVRSAWIAYTLETTRRQLSRLASGADFEEATISGILHEPEGYGSFGAFRLILVEESTVPWGKLVIGLLLLLGALFACARFITVFLAHRRYRKQLLAEALGD